jgi:hypothetical protein
MRNATPEYKFRDQFDQGKRAEDFLDHYFARWFHIQPVALETELSEGYDRIYTRKIDGEQLRIEYKADYQAAESKNAFIETISVYEDRKPGWAYTSQADMLIYYVPPLGTIHMIPLGAIRIMLPGWKLRFREVHAPNEGYRTYGLLVPLAVLARLGPTRQVKPAATHAPG